METQNQAGQGSPRILVLRGGAIGDFILTLPVFAMLRDRWPAAYMEVVGYPHVARLALEGGLVDRVTSLDKAEVARLFSLRPSIPDEQAAHVCSFSVIVSFLYDPDDTVRRNLLAVGARQVVTGSPMVAGRHACDFLLEPLAELALFGTGEERPQLALSPTRREAGAARLRDLGLGPRVLAVHPGSGGVRKNWPLPRFMELARRAQAETGMAPMLVLGEADYGIVAELATGSRPFPVLPACDLPELAGALSACQGFVGNDSGITHLAAALGVPTTAVFGPSDAALWGPRGPHVAIVRSEAMSSESLAELSVERVLAAVVAGSRCC